MMEEIKKGSINCIVVKDLSRFGRNYTETGNYLENIFPSLKVRFVSINDHYDSIRADANTMLTMALKNLCHSIYAKDISKKVCTSLDSKKKKGLFLAPYAPYGYQKSEEHKGRLVVDEKTAPIVRSIFQWSLEGMKPTAIARKLNDMGIPSQKKRLYDLGVLKGSHGEEQSVWSGSSVLGILENPNYYGCIIERKTEHAYYKGGCKKRLSKQEWIYLENIHEGIICKEQFYRVRELMEKGRRTEKTIKSRTRTENILSGLVICGCCGRRMIRDSGYYDKQGNLKWRRFGCPLRYKKENGCSSGTVKEADLVNLILSMTQVYIPTFYVPDGTNWNILENTKKLTRSFCEALIRKVVVSRDRVEIYFTFQEEWEHRIPLPEGGIFFEK